MGFEAGELGVVVRSSVLSCIFIRRRGTGEGLAARCLAVGVELVRGVLAGELQDVAVVGGYSELHDVMPVAVLVLELVIVAVRRSVVAHLVHLLRIPPGVPAELVLVEIPDKIAAVLGIEQFVTIAAPATRPLKFFCFFARSASSSFGMVLYFVMMPRASVGSRVNYN